ncbi:MAG: Integrator complex subunit 2 [Marteilia pararefringens]
MMQMIHTIGYDVAHLQYLVQNVPSIHICINFAIDILLKVPCDKKVFAVKLISNLATTYKLESSLNLCQMTLTILNNVFATMNESMRFKIFSQIIPDIFTICEVFPVLNIAVMRLLERLLSFCSDYSTSCTKSDQSALKKRIEAAKKSILKHKHTIQHNSAPLISLQ